MRASSGQVGRRPNSPRPDRGDGPVSLSLQELADRTGLSKRAVQDALGRLHRRKLIGIRRESITAVPDYTVRTPWRGRSAGA